MKENPEIQNDLDLIQDDQIRIIGASFDISIRESKSFVSEDESECSEFHGRMSFSKSCKIFSDFDCDDFIMPDIQEDRVIAEKDLVMTDDAATDTKPVHEERKKSRRGSWIMIIVIIAGIIAAIIWILLTFKQSKEAELTEPEPAFFEPRPEFLEAPVEPLEPLSTPPSAIEESYTEVMDTVINDVALKVFIPHNAELTLHLGKIDKSDSSIIYAAQAADVRADNGGIVGAFVINGEPRAWGLSKSGYCASIDGKVTVGVAANSPLFEEATEKGGYFFRQYPLVSNGQIVENELKGKSIRRAICDRRGEIFMVESGSIESFHDFSQALVDLGVDQAVYLVGSSAYGWAVDADGETHEFGEQNVYSGRRKAPKNINYIVWRKK